MEVKERILQKATDLFMRYGIRSITMDEIASQLGISKKTIYQFFVDKDDVVDGVVDAVIQDNEAKCDRFRSLSSNAIHEVFLAMEETEVMLKGMNPLIMYDLEKHHPRAHKKFRDHIHRFLYLSVKENLMRGIQEGVFRDDVHIEIAAKHRIESVFMGFNQDIFPNSRYRISDVFSELDFLFLHSIASPAGKQLIQTYMIERNKQLSHE